MPRLVMRVFHHPGVFDHHCRARANLLKSSREIPSRSSSRLGARSGTMSASADALIRGGDLEAVAGALDALELERGTGPDWPWAAHVLGHAALGNLAHARFVHERAPAEAQALAELEAARELVACLAARDHPGVHAAAASPAFTSALAPMVRHVALRHRADTIALIARAYTSVAVAHVAACLGVSEAEAIDMGTGLGWVHDAPAGMFDVVRPEPTERQGREAVDVVQRLTELAVVLDEAKK